MQYLSEKNFIHRWAWGLRVDERTEYVYADVGSVTTILRRVLVFNYILLFRLFSVVSNALSPETRHP